MATGTPASNDPQKFRPFVPEHIEMREFTWRAMLLGLALTVVLGAANAYLGLRAGITIAATYPAAVIAMAAMRAWKGSLLEENIARTAGSIGEAVAAGAIFTIPAFLIAKAWPSFRPGDAYWKSTALIMVGSILGVLFISLVRRVMVEDPELPFPESVAASEIHKAGRRGAEAAKYLFWNIGVGGVVYMLGRFGLFAVRQDFHFARRQSGPQPGPSGDSREYKCLAAGGDEMFSAPSVSPAYLGVGYIIGLRLASLQFAGSVLAWGLMVPLLMYFLGPQLQAISFPPIRPMIGRPWRTRYGDSSCAPSLSAACWWARLIRSINMRKSLTAGLGKAFADLRQTARPASSTLAHRAIHELQGGLWIDRPDVRTDVLSLHPYLGLGVAGGIGGGRDADCRLFLRHGFWQPWSASSVLPTIRFLA